MNMIIAAVDDVLVHDGSKQLFLTGVESAMAE